MEAKNAAARDQAKAQLASIREMVAALECDYERLEELKEERSDLVESLEGMATAKGRRTAKKELDEWDAENLEEMNELIEAAGECTDQDDARQRIEEDALSVEVRGGWYAPSDPEGREPEEFKILLCTGGPACQIIGELDDNNEPDRARLMYRDWFAIWEELILSSEEAADVLTYCQVFYFGE